MSDRALRWFERFLILVLLATSVAAAFALRQSNPEPAPWIVVVLFCGGSACIWTWRFWDTFR